MHLDDFFLEHFEIAGFIHIIPIEDKWSRDDVPKPDSSPHDDTTWTIPFFSRHIREVFCGVINAVVSVDMIISFDNCHICPNDSIQERSVFRERVEKDADKFITSSVGIFFTSLKNTFFVLVGGNGSTGRPYRG